MGSGDQSSSCSMLTGVPYRANVSGGMTTTRIHLVLRIRMNGTLPPIPVYIYATPYNVILHQYIKYIVGPVAESV